MFMKLETRLPGVLLVLLTASILWGVWGCTRPAVNEERRPMEGAAGQAGATSAPLAVIDWAATAGPPPVDSRADPSWARDPFATVSQAPAAEAGAKTAPTPAAEPVVRTILFSAQRSVALVDGHIVKVGDRVGDGVVVEISRDAVVIETLTGERKRLPLRMREGQK